MRCLIGLALLCLGAVPAGAEPQAHRLFIIERSKNANIVIYEARMDAPGVFAHEPVVAYWRMFTKGGTTEPLLFIERRAYGFSLRRTEDGYAMALAPFPRRPIALDASGPVPRGRMDIAGVSAWLERVYIRARDGGVLPKVEYIDLFGSAVDGGRPVSERIVP